MSVQAQYLDFRITEVIDNLAACETLSQEDITLKITGSSGRRPAWRIRHPRLLCLPEFRFAETYDPPTGRLLIAENNYHAIYADDNDIWIDLY